MDAFFSAARPAPLVVAGATLLFSCSASSTAPELGSGGSAGSAGGGGFSAVENGGSGSGFGAIGGRGEGAGSGVVDAAVCGSVSIDASVEEVIMPGNVLIIFDQSDSMDEDFNGVPKWRAASDAVARALTSNADALTIGAIFFPTADSIASVTFFFPCEPAGVAAMGTPPQIPFMPGPQFLQAWNQRWTAANLALSTPLDMGMTRGAEALAGAGLQGQIVVIVVTDGAPTCTTMPNSVQIAQTWLSLNIPTYVLGLPGGIGVPVLNDLATAGGTARQGGANLYLTPSDATALEQELASITSRVIARSLSQCDIVFNELPPDLEQVFLVVTDANTGQRYQVTRGPDGWDLGPNGMSAVLSGATCTDALNGRFSNVSFEFGCVDEPILIR